MLNLILFLAIVNSPYPFEPGVGFLIEPLIGTSLLDKTDDASLSSGARISYSNWNIGDAFITAEAQIIAHTVFSGAGIETPFTKFTAEQLLVFYEVFNPMAVRVAGGLGLELRKNNPSPTIYYRAGLGGYFNKDISLFFDIAQRHIIREAKYVAPVEITLSSQIIF